MYYARMLFLWGIVFLMTLFALVKSADYLVESAQKIGLFFRMSPFVIGVLVVGIGTSLPELASSIFAVLQDAPELVLSNAIGSNIANIFLIVGLSAILAKNIKVTKELVDLDIPLLLLATALFVVLAFDAEISRFDSVFLLAGLLYYLTYSVSSKSDALEQEQVTKQDFYKELVIFAVSLITLVLSAKYLIASVLNISSILNIAASAITLVAVALGTSLPELFVSISAFKKKQSDMALGNIFGSNVFNLLAVVGIPATFSNLPIDNLTYSDALPILLLATLLFAFSGISRKIHSFEGIFFLIIYAYFVSNLFG